MQFEIIMSLKDALRLELIYTSIEVNHLLQFKVVCGIIFHIMRKQYNIFGHKKLYRDILQVSAIRQHL